MGRNPVTPEVCHGRREPMDRNPVTPTATDPSRALSTERRATTLRQPSYTGRLITDRASIMVRAGVGEDGGGGEELFGVAKRLRTPAAPRQVRARRA